jgi:polysaccharide biosynthesis protein PslG
MATAIGDDYFDGHDTRERVLRHLRIAKELHVHYLRCAFSWNGIEPQPGKYDFRFWDMLVDESSRAGIEVIPYVAYTPEWAARTKQQFWKQPPADLKTFTTLMTALATHFRGRIHSWELWNEPDNRDYWEGSADEFADMVIPAAQAVRRADPVVKVVLGGLSYGPSEFLRELVSKHHIERYFDVIALHAYPESWHEERAEEAFQQKIPEMEEVVRHAPNRPALWLNEMGYSDYRYDQSHASMYGTNIYYSYEHTSRYTADFLLKSFLMAAASGDVNLAGWYRIDDFRENDPRMSADKVNDHLGLIRVNGSPKPDFYAFRLFNTLLSQPFRVIDGTVTASSKNDSQSIVHTFVRQDGEMVVAGWLRSSEYSEVPGHTGMLSDERREKVNLTLPCRATQITNYDALGRHSRTPLHGAHELQNVSLTGDRVYLVVVRCASGK